MDETPWWQSASEGDRQMAGLDNQPSTIDDKEAGEAASVDVEKVLEGKGLGEIITHGWEQCRQVLMQQPYSEIVKRQINQIEALNGDPAQPHPSWLVSQLNDRAEQRANQLAVRLTSLYPKDGNNNFHANSGGKKLWIIGKEVSVDANKDPELPITRLYFTVSSSAAPEAFQALISALQAEGVISKVDIALNMETYFEDHSIPFQNNTIILYVSGNHPEIIGQVAKAITHAKKSQPEPWQMSPKNLATAKASITRDFMIPLDDNVSLVEMPTVASYHSTVRGHAYREITNQLPFGGQSMSLAEFYNAVAQHTPDRPGLFDNMPERRKYMPALLQPIP